MALARAVCDYAGVEHDGPQADDLLHEFPACVDLGPALRIVGPAVRNPNAQVCEILARPGALPDNVRSFIARSVNRSCEFSIGQPTAPYCDLYRLALVRVNDLHVNTVLGSSPYTIGEFVPFGRIADYGLVEFPCVIQPLIGGARVQVHKDGNSLRIFAYHGTEISDDPRYLPVMEAFSGPLAPSQCIIECVLVERRQIIFALECVSWDGELTYQLPLRERLERLDRFGEEGPLRSVPWREVASPYELASLSRNAVIKPPGPLNPAHPGWLMAKPEHVQPGRPVPWQRCTNDTDAPRADGVASRPEGVYSLLGLTPSATERLVIQTLPAGSRPCQLHRVDGAVYIFEETHLPSPTVDRGSAEHYDDLPREGVAWVVNALRCADGRLRALDCLYAGATALDCVPLATRLTILKTKLAPHLDTDVDTSYDIVESIHELRERMAAMTAGETLLVRRASETYGLPMNAAEVTVTHSDT